MDTNLTTQNYMQIAHRCLEWGFVQAHAFFHFVHFSLGNKCFVFMHRVICLHHKEKKEATLTIALKDLKRALETRISLLCGKTLLYGAVKRGTLTLEKKPIRRCVMTSQVSM